MSEKENKNKPVLKVVKLGPWFFPIVAVSIILLIKRMWLILQINL